MNSEIKRANFKLLDRLSVFLNETPDLITKEMIKRLCEECQLETQEAFSILLAIHLGIDFDENEEDRFIVEHYFDEMLHALDRSAVQCDPYYRNIRIPPQRLGNWELKEESYKPFELFVTNDMMRKEDGRIIPQLGYFTEPFSFPAVLQNGREWMTITPNEIETMKEPISRARKSVLTYGLGLGYFAYMCSEKNSVDTVTIVERDKEVIELFEKIILPQFSHPEKIKIEQADAFAYAKDKMKDGLFDFVFCDLWHDVQDGLSVYRRMKRFEQSCPHTEFAYWIEKTLKCYMEE